MPYFSRTRINSKARAINVHTHGEENDYDSLTSLHHRVCPSEPESATWCTAKGRYGQHLNSHYHNAADIKAALSLCGPVFCDRNNWKNGQFRSEIIREFEENGYLSIYEQEGSCRQRHQDQYVVCFYSKIVQSS